MHQYQLVTNILFYFKFKFDTFPRWSPQDQEGGGQMTVISAGPGYREEKHYKIGNDGHVVEVPNSMTHDARKLYF